MGGNKCKIGGNAKNNLKKGKLLVTPFFTINQEVVKIGFKKLKIII
jgi:hypothetical protein